MSGNVWRQRFRAFGEPPSRTAKHPDRAVEPEPVGGPVDEVKPAEEVEPAEGVVKVDAAEPVPDSSVDEERLQTAFAWAAAGFTALTGILTFFGIKEGTLDQALRLYAPATLCIFIFLGIGVVSALFARALDFGVRLRLWVLIGLLLTMLLAASVFFPDLGAQRSRELARDAMATDEATWDSVRPWLAGLLILAVLALGVWLLGSSPDEKTTVIGTVVGGMALVGAVYLLLPRTADPVTGKSSLDEPRIVTTTLSAALLFGALWLLGWSLVRMTTLPVIAGLVVVAVTATSLGLYGATKLALEAKSLSVQPQVVAKLKSGESGDTVELEVKAGHFRGRNLLIDVAGEPRGQTLRTPADAEFPAEGADPITIWSALLKPDALDEIDQTIEVPLSALRWTNLTVNYCGFAEVDAAPEACGEATSRSTVVDVRNGGAEPGLQQITADIGPSGDDKLRVSFKSSDVTPGMLTKVELCRTAKGKHTSHVADATLAPDAKGTVTWEMTVPAGAAGDQLLLRHRSCPPGSPCAQEWQTLATYVME